MASDNSAATERQQYDELQPSDVGLFWPEGWKDPQAETPFRRLLRLMEERPLGVDLAEWDALVREAGYAHRGQVHFAFDSHYGRGVFAEMRGSYFIDIPGRYALARLDQQRTELK
jgi:hypothetical protein